ncbi:hypothetical protein QBC34DRAFT_419938 [Podospora aff. communis PSN243]|uniref:BHLH domain-containing protein n=1 Tax=Podospora aff. communis PSN243 TaxID=3040156 RepID=A0AAV9H538_9PEZI|nr:hypothetical protein QBC34DRAFT_419938 [Podospora aff. communis PSN243]
MACLCRLIDGYVPGELWSEISRNPISVDSGYSAGNQSIADLSPTTTYSGVSPFLDIGAPLFDRLSPASDALYSSSSSPLVPAPSTIGLYECTSQPGPSSLYPASYIPPATMQGFDFYSTDGFGLGTPESCVVASPVLAESNLTDTELHAAAYAGEPAYGTGQALTSIPPVGIPQHKRARTSPEQDVGTRWNKPSGSDRPLTMADSTPEASSSASGKGKKKLRSASRSSKNINHKPDETPEERRSRNAHNVVEKQYRSRLNARFEGLLGALPNSLRSPGTGESDSEVRLTKGDVLDMSMTYIRTLESQRSELEKEHEELNTGIARLHTLLANKNRLDVDGFGSDGT